MSELKSCPDGGACHHICVSKCFRVSHAGPLSGVFPGDEWPADLDPRPVVSYDASQSGAIAGYRGVTDENAQNEEKTS